MPPVPRLVKFKAFKLPPFRTVVSVTTKGTLLYEIHKTDVLINAFGM